MKKNVILLIAALSGISLLSISGCTNPNKISPGAIVRQVNKTLKNKAVNQEYVTITVGTYECNSEADRLELRKMEAAGLIEYEVERYAWWEKSKKTERRAYEVPHYSYWYGSYTTTEYKYVKTDRYDFEDHYVVTVELTKKGSKYVLTELPIPVEEEDPDMKEPEIDPLKYAWNQKDLSEEWPDIENPFIQREDKSASTEKKDNSSSKSKSNSSSSTNDSDDDSIERIDNNQYLAYRDVVFDSSDIIVETACVKAIKARNIQLHKPAGTEIASAEVILMKENVTDFGRILSNLENGEKDCIDVQLEYYLDKGWVLKDED